MNVSRATAWVIILKNSLFFRIIFLIFVRNVWHRWDHFFSERRNQKSERKKKKNEAQPLAYLRVGCKWLCIYGSGVWRVFFFLIWVEGSLFEKIVQRGRVLFGLCFVFVPRVIVRLVLCDSSLDHCGWGWDEGNFEFSKWL